MIKLLIIDDEKGLCEYLRDFFKPLGYDVRIATNGNEALNIAKKEKPELVFLDIEMPDMNGLEVLRLLKKSSPETKVIMITVSDDADTKEKAKALGADEFITKPFTTDYLEDVVILKVSEISKTKEPANILIVDDEEEVRVSLKSILDRRFECRISEAGSGEETLKLLKKDKFDLVLLDIKMPGISGLEVIKEARKLEQRPCIWVITGFDSEEMAHNVIKEGADDYIPKPFSVRLLDRKIRDFLASIGKYKPKGSADFEK